MRALRDKLPAGGRVRVRTPCDLLTTAGRLALWLTIALLLVRGAAAMLGSEALVAEPTVGHAARAPGWPDDAVRALAVEFATAYLTHTAGEQPDAAARRLTGLASPEVTGELAPRFDHDAPGQAVRSATIAGATVIDERHALISVAATIATADGLSTRRLTVPVARDNAGGLVVDDLPSFTAAPARAAAAPRDDEPLRGPDRAQVEDVLGRFLRAYLAGDTGGLAYLIVPGTRMVAAAGRFELLSLASVMSAGSATRGRRAVLVTAHARDRESGALYMLRYRVRLVRRDRWYVAEINGPGKG